MHVVKLQLSLSKYNSSSVESDFFKNLRELANNYGLKLISHEQKDTEHHFTYHTKTKPVSYAVLLERKLNQKRGQGYIQHYEITKSQVTTPVKKKPVEKKSNVKYKTVM